MNTSHDAIRLMDAMAQAERHARSFNTAHFVTAIESDPMQTTTAAHEIGSVLKIVVEVMDAAKVNLNDLHHPSPLHAMVEATRVNGWRTMVVLRGPAILANDRRIPILAGLLGPHAKLILAVTGEPPAIPSQVLCDLRQK